jgi:uncharacterized protein
MNGSITHIEIGAATSEKSAAFFSELFDWTYNPMGQDGGWFNTPTCKAGLHPSDPTPNITVYFAVSDIEQAAAKVRALGGDAGQISPEEPNFGRFCNCKDPQGVPFGLHQKPHG